MENNEDIESNFASVATEMVPHSAPVQLSASAHEKPPKFDGMEFKRWQQKMLFYLTTLNLAKFLKEECPVLSEENTADRSTVLAVDAWNHSEFLCRNYILNGLHDSLYNIYLGIKTAKALWESLEKKLAAQTRKKHFGRRNSMDNIVGSIYDANEKENEKEQTLKTVKMRSPSVPKTSKHFMAPTISTASKITAPSPRKKVLTDKQESPRTSINGMENYDSKAHIHPSVNSNVSGSDVVTDNESNLVVGDLSSRFKIGPSPTQYSLCPIIAPLDADPLVAPPYDPKTNFLSPRPQFLRYRRNPQIGSYVHDDILTFESLSVTETTEESGSASEELVVETDDDSLGLSEKAASFESLLETETASERLVTETEGDSSVENKVDDSDPIRTQLDMKCGESKGVPKKPFFTKVKSISLILIVVAACLSISLVDNQIINTSLFKDQAFLKILDDPNEIYKYVKENYDGVAEKISFWSSNCISYFTKPIQVSTNEQLSVVQFYNLTALQDDQLFPIKVSHKTGDEIVSVDEKGSVEIEDYRNEDVSVSRYVLEVEVHVEVIEETDADSEVEALGATENADSEVEDLDDEPEMVDSEAKDFEELENVDSEVLILSLSQHEVRHEEMDADSEVEALGAPKNADNEANGVDELKNLSSEVPILSSTQHEVVDEPENPLMIKPESNYEAKSIETEEIHDSSEPIVSSNLYEIPVTFETWDSTTDNNHSEAKVSSLTNIFGVCLLATSLILATTFVVVKQINSFKPKETVTKKAFSTIEWTHSSLNEDNQTEVIMESEPCQSEMSSCEAESCENRIMLKKRSAKRESSASSLNLSMGSASYGSFTTYEIIQKKRVDEEERMVTPVRRSSRIRSHVTSP